jgi:sugar transferase (PEP-CTERM/EpsH1 system associated)
VVPSLAVGGLENGVVNIIGRMPDFRHAVISIGPIGALGARLSSDVEVVTLEKSPERPMRTAALRLLLTFRRLRPDIVHARNWGSIDAIVAAKLAAVAAVIYGEHGREFGDPDGRHCRRNLIRRLLNPCVDRFATVSADLGRWLVDVVGLPRRKLAVIPNGVDLECFSADGRQEGRRALGRNDDAPVIGTVGRLDAVKDHATLLRAFAEVARITETARLVVVGDGPQRASLHALVQSLRLAGRVDFLGERRDVALLMKGFDIFVLPSLAEGASNTVLEAMATGLPVVATRAGGTPELVEDGVTGTLVAVRDATAVAKASLAYLWDSELRAGHGRAGRERVAAQFSLERMADGYRRLYASVVGSSGAL